MFVRERHHGALSAFTLVSRCLFDSGEFVSFFFFSFWIFWQLGLGRDVKPRTKRYPNIFFLIYYFSKGR